MALADRVASRAAERQISRSVDPVTMEEFGYLLSGQQGTVNKSGVSVTARRAMSIPAWKRGTQRAGIPNTQFRDLRAKALTDVDEKSGIIAAQRMGAHSTQAQTADYIRNKKAIKSTATR